MRLPQVLQLSVVGLLVVLAFGLVWAWGGSSGALGSGFQPVPGKGVVYVTRLEQDGAILKVRSLTQGVFDFDTIAKVNYPSNILCGLDGRLYVIEGFARDGNREVHRILRFNQDGSGRTVVAQWNTSVLRPGAMVFAPNGDLYFGTASTVIGRPHKGVWRIPGVLQAENFFNPPEQILTPEFFTPPPLGMGAGANPYAFLTTGAFVGDLLIMDKPRYFVGSTAGPENPGTRVLRASKPNFNTVTEFIPRLTPRPVDHDDDGGLAINSQGDVFMTDMTNGKVLRYNPDGTFVGVFAEVQTAGQIAIGPDDIVYVTNVTFPPGGPAGGGLFIFDPEGKLLAKSGFPIALYGVTVCAPQ